MSETPGSVFEQTEPSFDERPISPCLSLEITLKEIKRPVVPRVAVGPVSERLRPRCIRRLTYRERFRNSKYEGTEECSVFGSGFERSDLVAGQDNRIKLGITKTGLLTHCLNRP